MQTAGNEKKKTIVTFSILLLTTGALIFLLMTSLSDNSNAAPTVNNTGANSLNAPAALKENRELQMYQEQLLERLNELQQQDRAYSAAITEGNEKQAAKINAQIHQQEEAFNAALDSLNFNVRRFRDDSVKNSFTSMIRAFRSQLENRLALGSMRNALAMHQDGFSADEKTVLKLQDELAEKNGRLTTMERALAAANAERSEIKRSSAGIDDRTQELTQQVAALETKVANLTATNIAFRQDNERLAKLAQNNHDQPNPASTELALKEKNFAQQQRIDALNAEIQLLKVDYNLNRVDATQIISTSKQRKQLLTEASGILNTLNTTGNEEVRRKVRERIERLNNVASNARE